MEQFSNNAITTIQAPGGISAIATFIPVVSVALFPSQGRFRLRIDQELMIVTAVASNGFTVIRGQEGTTATVHANGANVYHVLTAGALAQMAADILAESILGLVVTAPNWYVDPAHGDDDNDGLTSGTALASFAGLQQKWGPNPLLKPTGGTLTVNLLNDAVPTDELPSFEVDPDSIVVFIGQKTSILTGTVTSAVTINRASNIPWSITDTSVSSWTSHLEQRARITSGPRAGNTFWIAKDLGSHQARISAPLNSNTFLGSPSMGSVASTDPYILESLTQIYIGEFNPTCHAGLGTATYPSVYFIDLKVSTSGNFQFLIGGNCDVIFQDCLIAGDFATSVQSDNFGMVFLNCCTAAGTTQHALTTLAFYAGLVHQNLEMSTAGTFSGQVYLDADVLFQGSTLDPLGLLRIGTAGFFDAPGPGISSVFGVYLANNVLAMHALYGSGNAQYGVDMPSNTWFFYASTIPTITGTSGDFRLGGATTAHAWDPSAHAYTASIACTWANLALALISSGFGGTAHQLDANVHLNTTPSAG